VSPVVRRCGLRAGLAFAADGTHLPGVVEILEQGAVSFLALTRPGTPEPRGPGDLDRFFLVLAPAGRRPLRRLAVRRRRLPAEGQRFYAHVDRLATRAARLTDDVRTSGRGRPRVLAVGHYALARHGDHVHLAYGLARACGRGRLAAALGVCAGASFVLCAFLRSLPPTRRQPSALPLAPATPERLDVIGAEVALVACARARDAALGIAGGAPDRVGEALVGALLRRGPRPRVRAG
jgi:hypothetical protein